MTSLAAHGLGGARIGFGLRERGGDRLSAQERQGKGAAQGGQGCLRFRSKSRRTGVEENGIQIDTSLLFQSFCKSWGRELDLLLKLSLLDDIHLIELTTVRQGQMNPERLSPVRKLESCISTLGVDPFVELYPALAHNGVRVVPGNLERTSLLLALSEIIFKFPILPLDLLILAVSERKFVYAKLLFIVRGDEVTRLAGQQGMIL